MVSIEEGGDVVSQNDATLVGEPVVNLHLTGPGCYSALIVHLVSRTLQKTIPMTKLIVGRIAFLVTSRCLHKSAYDEVPYLMFHSTLLRLTAGCTFRCTRCCCCRCCENVEFGQHDVSNVFLRKRCRSANLRNEQQQLLESIWAFADFLTGSRRVVPVRRSGRTNRRLPVVSPLSSCGHLAV